MSDTGFPRQKLHLSSKGKVWRKQCVDSADNIVKLNYSSIRNNMRHYQINYDLVNGILHMEDLEAICNPEGIKAEYIPKNIQHYPIINAKLNLLNGEEKRRPFNYSVVVTNPTAISDIEKRKKDEMFAKIQEQMYNTSQSEEEFQENLDKIRHYFEFEWQDFREFRGNCVLGHYIKEYDMATMFNAGFSDGEIIGEEYYHLDIVGGEPYVEKVNPKKLRLFGLGSSNKAEDADMAIIEDYWQKGRIYDYFAGQLTKKDMDYIENLSNFNMSRSVDGADNIDERQGFVRIDMMSDVITSDVLFDPFGKYTNLIATGNATDSEGNIRVLRVYWKSRKLIKKIKFYDPETGEEDFTFMSESYIPDSDRGEEEEAFWVNQAWEGTKIGDEVYVNIRPKAVQYNRLDNPSKCCLGIVGSIYNINDGRPFSLVDMMKSYNYLYDITHDRLNKALARNWGRMPRLDLAKKPNSWKMEKWLYYAKTLGLFIEDSFNAGLEGPALGKVAGGLNSNSQGVIDADAGNIIQQYINLLEFIKMEMSDVVGISKQREGQVSNRETVGGVERATLQSSHITENIFTIHESIKRRVLNYFLDTAKIAFKGRTKKFQYILPNFQKIFVDIDGDEFAECDYGVMADDSNYILDLNQKLEGLAQAALQNSALKFSTITKIFQNISLAEKQKLIEADEKETMQRAEQQRQQEAQAQQQQIQAEAQMHEREMQAKEEMNRQNNEVKLQIANINSQAEFAILQLKNKMTEADIAQKEAEDDIQHSQEEKDKLLQEMQQFSEKMKLERDKLAWDKEKTKKNNDLKRELANKKK